MVIGTALNLGPASGDERNNEEDKKNHEENFGNPGGGACDPSEAQNGRNDCDDQKNNGVV